MEILKLKVPQMNQQQICSFINGRFAEESWFTPISAYEEAEVIIDKFQKPRTFDKVFPDTYTFVGNQYYDCDYLAEESGFTPVKNDLVLLGSASIYKELERIVYIDPCIYAEDSDIPPVPHPKTMRISFRQYRKMLDNLKKEIEKAESLVN
ncbi:MAG: hypothetical protein WBB28_06710 [Crinalium sp.]